MVHAGRRRHTMMLSIACFAAGFLTSSLLWMGHSWSILLEQQQQASSSSLMSPQRSASWRQLDHQNHLPKGWKTVHVFYGNTSHLVNASSIPNAYMETHEYFSQYRQDEVVAALFQYKRHGYFIDLAANDPVRISNTFALERKFDWNGLCLEANPLYWAALAHRKCAVIGAVVGTKSMEEVIVRLPVDKAPMGGIVGHTFDNDPQAKHSNTGGHDPAKMHSFQHKEFLQPRFTVRLKDLFQQYYVPKVIDYMSLDVEGAEDFIMKAFPFDQYIIIVLTIERPSPSLQNLLHQHGYEQVKELRRNNAETLWMHMATAQSQGLNMTVLDDMDTMNYKYREK